jgi:hypothetical protein
MPALQQPHRPVHLGEQARDGRLAGARVAEEHEVLRGRHLGKAVALALGLHLQEGDERAHLLLDRLEAGQRIELVLELGQRLHGLRLAERVDLVRDPVARFPALRKALAEHAEAAGYVLEWIRRHAGILPGADRSSARPARRSWFAPPRR